MNAMYAPENHEQYDIAWVNMLYLLKHVLKKKRLLGVVLCWNQGDYYWVNILPGFVRICYTR